MSLAILFLDRLGYKQDRPLIEALSLRTPIYSPTAKHGHFGRTAYEGQYYDRVKREHRGPKLGFFAWEKTD